MIKNYIKIKEARGFSSSSYYLLMIDKNNLENRTIQICIIENDNAACFKVEYNIIY